jgi:uncharacterized glyoxalase superfamily protein PhnB
MSATHDPSGGVHPYLLYENLGEAIEWLQQAFGFEERMRLPGPDGKVGHAEMVHGDGRILMGHPGPKYKNPKRVGYVTHHLYVYVDDVDAHHARAQAAGARILETPADQPYGERRYGAADPEGHTWYFAQPLGGPPAR